MSPRSYAPQEKWEILLEALGSANGPEEACFRRGITLQELRRWLAIAREGALARLSQAQTESISPSLLQSIPLSQALINAAIANAELPPAGSTSPVAGPTQATPGTAASVPQTSASQSAAPHAPAPHAPAPHAPAPHAPAPHAPAQGPTAPLTMTPASPGTTAVGMAPASAQAMPGASTAGAVTAGTATALPSNPGASTASAPSLQTPLRSVMDPEQIDAMFSMVSHELKEPVRGVRALCQFLQEDLDGQLDEHSLGYLRMMGDSAARMQSLVDGLGEYARVLRALKPDQQVPLGDVLRTLRQSLQPMLNGRNATLAIDSRLPTVKGDPTALGQMFRHLLSNGLKFNTSPTPKLEITLGSPQSSLGEEINATVVLVRDNGIGIDHRQFERIFELFQRLHRYEVYPGAGVGLAVVKKVMEAHGGKVTLESTPGAGTTVRLSFPPSATDAPSLGSSGHAAQELSGAIHDRTMTGTGAGSHELPGGGATHSQNLSNKALNVETSPQGPHTRNNLSSLS